MLLVSIVDKDVEFRNRIIHTSKTILNNLQISFTLFDSISNFLKKSEHVKRTDIVMISTACIKDSYEIYLNILDQVQRNQNLYILFYGDDIQDIALISNIEHFYYFLKNQMDSKLPIALKKGLRLLESSRKEKLVIKFKHTIDVIDVSEILYITRNHRILMIYTCDQVYLTYMNFDEILNMIKKDTLIQINYSCLIQPKWVEKYNNTLVSMLDSTCLKITDKHRVDTLQVLSNLNKTYDVNLQRSEIDE